MALGERSWHGVGFGFSAGSLAVGAYDTGLARRLARRAVEGTQPAEDVFHRVVAFMTRHFIHGTDGLPERERHGPSARVANRVVKGVLVSDKVVALPGKPLD